MVYVRKVGKRELNFQVSGKLWMRSLVMRDEETGSLWSHILGRCMDGALKGKELTIVPSVMTTWADWKKEHSKTTVLDMSRSASGYDADFYKRRSRFVLGVVLHGKAKAYAFDRLWAKKVAVDRIGDVPVLVTFHEKSTRAQMFSRKLGDKVLEFERDLVEGKLVDSRGGVWDLVKGLALSGPYQGKQLEVLPAIPSLKRSWKEFHPDTQWYVLDSF